MSDTPETDAAEYYIRQEGHYVRSYLARRLERERDEAREELKKLEGAYEDATFYYARMIKLKEERDEALKNLEEEMKFHHRTHSELVKANCKILDLQMQLENQKVRIGELMDFGNKLADECDRILGLGLHQNTLLRFKDALESWRKNT